MAAMKVERAVRAEDPTERQSRGIVVGGLGRSGQGQTGEGDRDQERRKATPTGSDEYLQHPALLRLPEALSARS